MATFTRSAYVQPQGLTTTQRDTIAQTADNIGLLIWNTTLKQYERWDGAAWQPLHDGGGVIEGGTY